MSEFVDNDRFNSAPLTAGNPTLPEWRDGDSLFMDDVDRAVHVVSLEMAEDAPTDADVNHDIILKSLVDAARYFAELTLTVEGIERCAKENDRNMIFDATFAMYLVAKRLERHIEARTNRAQIRLAK